MKDKASQNVALLQGTLDMLILKALQTGPKHGYQIVSWLALTSEQALAVEEGSLYPALHRMQRKGWLASSWGTSDANRRAKYYKLTRAGRKQLSHQVDHWASLTRAISLVVSATTEEGT